MNGLTGFILQGLQIILINIVLSVDNVSMIALATRNLPPRRARLANKLGIFVALILRILFVIIVGFLFKINWLPINFIGGVILIIITFHMLKEPTPTVSIREHGYETLIHSLLAIVVADVSMSFDNVFAIASIALGSSNNFSLQQINLLIFGLVICIPIIFWGSELIIKLMRRFPIIIYLCSGILILSGLKMIFNDNLLKPYLEGYKLLIYTIEILSCFIIVIYGVYKVRKKHNIGILSIIDYPFHVSG